MANRFLNNIRINDAYTFPASDGNDGQVITTDGAGNLAFENVSPDAASVIYRDNFTGDGSTVTFDLQNSITDEDQTQIYIDGVYQEKSTYSISGTTITFTTAPILGHSVEVISISSINTGPTVLYQDNFTGNGNDTAFTLGQIIDNEIKTFIFLNGVYQFKNTYTVDGTTLTFDTAPANGVAIEVVSIASAVQSDSLEAGSVIIPVKNTHTASISKGTPVYITGNVGASERLQIAPADASNSVKMPAAGLLLTTLAVNEEGYVITGGYLRNLTTDTIDSTSTSSNDTVYVKAGGGLTMTKPTGSNLIQNIAKVARSASGSSGSLLVSSILRTNDVPNITNDYFWLGNSSGVATATSYTSRFDTAFATKNTDDLSEGSTNLYYTDARADARVALIVDSAPATLDTLNELAAALGDDANFSTTVTNSIATKMPLAGGTFTGAVVGTSFSAPSGFINGSNGGIRIHSSGTKFFNITAANAARDNIMDIGASDARFKDLYLGGNIQAAGNIGIGTTSPNGNLQFSNAAETRKIVLYEGANNDYQFYGFGVESSTLVYSTYTTDDDHVFFAGTSSTTRNELMRISGDGNVGIGTANPATYLDIAGDSIAIGTSYNFSINANNDGNWGFQVQRTTGQDDYNTRMKFFPVQSSQRKLGFWNAATSSWMGYFDGSTGSNNNFIINGGSVGIGTSSPGYKLQVAGTIGTANRLAIKETNFGYSSSYKVVQFGESAATKAISLGYDPSGNTNGSFSGNEILIPNNIRILAPAANNSGYYGLMMLNSSNKVLLGASNYLMESNYIMALDTATKNVGIGTDSPAAILDVQGTSALFITRTSGGLATYIENDGGYPFLAMYQIGGGAKVLINTNGNSYFNGGNIGIGTTSPSEIFHVNKNATSRIVGAYFTNSQANTGAEAVSIAFGLNRSGGDFVRQVEAIEFGATQQWTGTPSTVNSYLAFNVVKSETAYERMRVTTNGVDVTSSGAHGVHLKPDTADTNNSGRLFLTRVGGSGWAIMNNSQNFSIRSGAAPNTTSGTEKIRLTGYSATSWTSGSDETMKENIIPINDVLDKIQNYRCVEYNFIDDETADKKIGFIAQDWQEDFPQIIEQMENEKIGMKYTETIPILLKAIQELKAEVETLKNQINGIN
jgi:hypothetical protein